VKISTALEDVGLLLLVGILLPVVIFLIGSPLVLLAWLVAAITR
jgi:hypothetical protein